MTEIRGTPGLEAPADDAPHVLVVDDDTQIRERVMRFLSQNGFRVTAAPDAATARASLRGLEFDIVVLDVMMPGESGLSLARDLKRIAPVPICMLTAMADKDDRVKGLEAGVDDYMAKPFEPQELVWRLNNILKRGKVVAAATPRDEVRMGAYVFHIGRGELRRGVDSIRLTERERDLMRLFAQTPNTPIQRHLLASDDATGSERSVDVQINRLRRKIETDPSNPVYLQTVRGKGYVLCVDP